MFQLSKTEIDELLEDKIINGIVIDKRPSDEELEYYIGIGLSVDVEEELDLHHMFDVGIEKIPISWIVYAKSD